MNEPTEVPYKSHTEQLREELAKISNRPGLYQQWLAEAYGVQLPAARTGAVYVAGPMSGLPNLNFPAFHAAADALRAAGRRVVNPADHGEVPGAEWGDYLRADLAQMMGCEAIHLLPGWSRSRGAQLEYTVATALGMAVEYAEGAEGGELARLSGGVHTGGWVAMAAAAATEMGT